MYGFKLHMGGLYNDESTLVKYNGKNVVRFKDTVVVGNGDRFSFAKVGEMFWVIFQTGGYQTAMLLDQYGLGTVPCSTGNLSGYITQTDPAQDAQVVIQATTLQELDTDDQTRMFIIDSLYDALEVLYVRTNGWAPMMEVSEDEYLHMFWNMEGTLSEYEYIIVDGPGMEAA